VGDISSHLAAACMSCHTASLFTPHKQAGTPAVNSLLSEFLAAKPSADSVTSEPLCLMVATMYRSCACTTSQPASQPHTEVHDTLVKHYMVKASGTSDTQI
jgi:hypothetical protein